MSDANKALAEVRGWLCDNLGSGDAGKVCGMLSVVSRRINELEAENAKLRELCIDLFDRLMDKDEHCGECRLCEYDAWNFGDPKCVYAKRMRELGVLHAKE